MNTLKIIVFFIFFSHINTLFPQKNNIIPQPIEQTINSGYMEIENSPEIIADFELNSAATLFKDAVKELELAIDKQTKNRIIFSLNKKLNDEEYIFKYSNTGNFLEIYREHFERISLSKIEMIEVSENLIICEIDGTILNASITKFGESISINSGKVDLIL